jgi:hypothetical protein
VIKSPSKHIPLARLYQIRQDNYVGESGQEYCQFEVEAEIATKEQAQAMALVTGAKATQKRLAKASAVNDLLANTNTVKNAPKFVLRERIKPTLFPLGA